MFLVSASLASAKRVESQQESDMDADTENLERLCQGVSPNDEPCDYPAAVHCAKCSRWFCDAHAEDENWHTCMLPAGDEGGEA